MKTSSLPSRARCLIDAYCTDRLDADELRELESILEGDGRARRFFAAYCRMHAGLLFAARAEQALFAARDLAEPRPAPAFAPLSGAWQGAVSYFSQVGPLSYLLAVAITGAMLLAGWAYKITHDYGASFAQNSTHAKNSRGLTAPGEPAQRPEPIFVARVTGMNDCRWADTQTETYSGAFVPLGRKYALASGLMEITYDSGAKVILEGPCRYEVESAAGGFLELGKLTAKVESGEWRVESAKSIADSSTRRKQRSEVGDQRSEAGGLAASAASVQPQAAKPQVPSPKPQAPRPEAEISKSPNHQISKSFFSVRTPTALITDLGTEFGVEVGDDGATEVHVLDGVVEAVPLRDGRVAGKPQRLVAGQIGSITAVAREVEVKAFEADRGPNRFVRSLPAALTCTHRTGRNEDFGVSVDDLIAAGRPTLLKIELTSGEVVHQGGVNKLNDGDVYGDEGTGSTRAAFSPSDGAAITIVLNTQKHALGYDVQSIVSLTGSDGWGGYQDRSSQKYDVAYSTVGEPDRFIPLHCDVGATVNRDAGGRPEMQVVLSCSDAAPIAVGVAKLRFTFHNTSSIDPESVFREIDVLGKPTESSETLPSPAGNPPRIEETN